MVYTVRYKKYHMSSFSINQLNFKILSSWVEGNATSVILRVLKVGSRFGVFQNSRNYKVPWGSLAEPHSVLSCRISLDAPVHASEVQLGVGNMSKASTPCLQLVVS